MGARRAGNRRRLYSLNKFGQSVDLGAGPGIKDAIVSATQRREGSQIVTQIEVDLGTSKAAIRDSGTGGDGDLSPVGVDGLLAYVTQLTEAKYGIITEVRAVMTELPTGATADIDLEYGADTAGKSASAGAGTRAGTPVSILTSLTAKGEDTSATYDNNALSNKYLYICQGANATSAEYTAGKITILLYGFVAPADI